MLKFLELGTMLLESLVQVLLDRKGPHLFVLLFYFFLGKKNLVSNVINLDNEHLFSMNLDLIFP